MFLFLHERAGSADSQAAEWILQSFQPESGPIKFDPAGDQVVPWAFIKIGRVFQFFSARGLPILFRSMKQGRRYPKVPDEAFFFRGAGGGNPAPYTG